MKQNKTQKSSFENYLIMIGIRSLEYTYTDEQLFENKKFFKECYLHGMGAYKALLFLEDYLNGGYSFDTEHVVEKGEN